MHARREVEGARRRAMSAMTGRCQMHARMGDGGSSRRRGMQRVMPAHTRSMPMPASTESIMEAFSRRAAPRAQRLGTESSRRLSEVYKAESPQEDNN